MKLLKRLTIIGVIGGMTLTLVVAGLIYDIEQGAHKITISSKLLGEARPIKIFLPSGYAEKPQKHFPVVYTVDGERIRTSSAAVLSGRIVTERDFILVAIDMIGKRGRDLRREDARAFDSDAGGQSERFLDFIETELFPQIADKYRTTPERILAGHSYGGMFTMHTMSLRPHLFDGYLAFSPALNADNRSLPDLAKFLQSDIAAGKSLYMNLGWETLYEYDVRFEEARTLIRTNMPTGFRFESHRWWLVHGAVPIPGFLQGLSFYFDGRAS